MAATSLRVRLAPTFEWAVAALFLVATLLVGLLLVRELRSSPAEAPVPVTTEPTAAGPSAVPDRAISVPTLLLADGSQIKVGDRADAVERLLGPSAESAPAIVEAGPLGQRTIRTYGREGTSFLLVLEPFERNGAPRVAGIYLQ